MTHIPPDIWPPRTPKKSHALKYFILGSIAVCILLLTWGSAIYAQEMWW